MNCFNLTNRRKCRLEKQAPLFFQIDFYWHFFSSFTSFSPLPLLFVEFVAANHSSLPLDFTFRDGPLLLSFAQCCHLVNWTAMSWNDCVGPNCSAPRHWRNTLFLCVCFFFWGGGSIWVFLQEYPPQLCCYWSYVTRTHSKWDQDDSSKWAPEREAESLTSTHVVSLKS